MPPVQEERQSGQCDTGVTEELATADGPDFLFVAPCDVEDAVSARVEIGLGKCRRVRRNVDASTGDAERASVKSHPEALRSIVLHEAHGLYAFRGVSIMGNPKGLAILPCEVKVAAARDGKVSARRDVSINGSDLSGKVRRTGYAAGRHAIQRGVDSFLDKRLPIAAGVGC